MAGGGRKRLNITPIEDIRRPSYTELPSVTVRSSKCAWRAQVLADDLPTQKRATRRGLQRRLAALLDMSGNFRFSSSLILKIKGENKK